MIATCPHLADLRDVSPPRDVCEDCVEIGGTWKNLRQCLTCGRTACCDSSPNTHATRHHEATGDPIVRSLTSGETWIWCYVCREVMERDADGAWQRTWPE